MPEFIDKTKSFLALQDELRLAVTIGSQNFCGSQESAVEDLSGYFENPEQMKRAFSVGGFRYEHAFLQRNNTSPWVDKHLRLMLREFREARDRNAGMCFQTWSSHMESVELGTRNISLVASLQLNIDELEEESLTKSVFRDIGDVLEGSLQPLVRLRLAMLEVAGTRIGPSSPVSIMTFGDVIGELSSRGAEGDIYRPRPLGLSVSQWRNIANHNNYTFKDGRVTCTYGRPGREKDICCTINNLIELAKYTDTLGFLHKVAYEIFSTDNLNELIPYAPQLEVTDYTRDGALVYGLAEAGFEIVKARYSEGLWVLLLIDDYNRDHGRAKAALEAAVLPYFNLTGPTEFRAVVKSGTSDFRISFRVSRFEGGIERVVH